MSTQTHASGSPAGIQNGIVKVVFASLIGTATEWYDFFLYGSAAALVFGKLSSRTPTPSPARCWRSAPTPWASWPGRWAAWSSATSVTGSAGKKMLVVSLLMMGFGTIAIGLLPTYATIGVAAPILLVYRLVQGFAVGGEWAARC